MELNTVEHEPEDVQQYEPPRRQETLLDAWMNGLRKMFGKRKKPPRYVKTDSGVAAPASTNTNELQNMNQQTKSPESQLTSESMFGGHIEDSVDSETGVARFVLWCVRAIETTGEGLKTDGIYTTIGDQTRVNIIMQQDEQHMQTCLAREDNVNAMAGALKVFFRQLKSPLFEFQDFSRAFQSKNPLVEMRLLVNSLEIAHSKTLSFVIHHLSRTLQLQKFNKVCLLELGVVFGPTLMRLSPNCHDMAGEMKQQNIIIEFLIKNCDAIFPDHESVPDESDSALYKGATAETNRDTDANDNGSDSDDTVQGSLGATDCQRPGNTSSSDEGGFDDPTFKVSRLPEVTPSTSRPPVPAKGPRQLPNQNRSASIVAASSRPQLPGNSPRQPTDQNSSASIVAASSRPQLPGTNQNNASTVAASSRPQLPDKGPRQPSNQNSNVAQNATEEKHNPRVLSWTVKDAALVVLKSQSGSTSSGDKIRPVVPPKPGSDVQQRTGVSKKTRSTPVDSYVQRASSESDESDASDSYDSDVEVEGDAVAKSIPTAL